MSARQRIEGKRVLITGGASGIGLEMAIAFGKEGCEVIITDINEEGLEGAASRIRREAPGTEVHTYVNDVSVLRQVDELSKEIHSRLGGVDILVNNAGIGFSSELKDTTIKEWKRLMGINVWGVIYFVRAFIPSMIERRSGHIVNISSGQAFFPVPTWGAYAATKFFVAGFSEALYYEAAHYGVRVTTVFPFMVNSPFYHDIETDSPGMRFVMKRIVPIIGSTPEKTAKIIVRAVKKGKRQELHHVFQKVPYYLMRLAPHAVEGAGLGATWAMTRKGSKGP